MQSLTDNPSETRRAYIDPASPDELVALFRRPTFRNAMHWSRLGGLASTLAILQIDDLRFPNRPPSGEITFGEFKTVNSQLLQNRLIDYGGETMKHPASSLRDTKNWVLGNAQIVRQAYQQLRMDAFFLDWADETRRHDFIETIRRNGSLVDDRFSPELAAVLDMTEQDVDRIRTETSRTSLARNLQRRKNVDSGLAKTVCDLYFVSILLRGLLHDDVARRAGYHILHHPVRSRLFSAIGTPGRQVAQPLAIVILALLIICDAFEESNKQRRRIVRWAECVSKARVLVRAEASPTPAELDETAANRWALSAGKKLGLFRPEKPWANVVDEPSVSGVLTILRMLTMNRLHDYAPYYPNEEIIDEMTRNGLRLALKTIDPQQAIALHRALAQRRAHRFDVSFRAPGADQP